MIIAGGFAIGTRFLSPRPIVAREVADHVIFMDGGVIVEQEPPQEILNTPKEDRTKQFLSRYILLIEYLMDSLA